MVSIESWGHIKIVAWLLCTGIGTVAGGGMWVSQVNDRVNNNTTQIERNTATLVPVVDTTTRMDERQQEIKRQLDRIERLLAEK